MSCELQLTATLEGINKFLDEEKSDYIDKDGSRKTLQSFKIAMSPTGEIVVFGKSTWLLICVSKWNSSVTDGVKIKYTPNWHGHINCKPGEEITSILCWPFFSQGQSSLGCADWTCVILGFSSGCIKFYTEEMQELACSILHEERITDIKYFYSMPPHQEKPQKQDNTDIYVLYKTVICILSKSQLTLILQNKRNELAKGYSIKKNETESYLTFDFKKYSFVGQEEIVDACFLGQTLMSSFNTFDHLVTASLVGGFNSNYRASPPQTSLIITSGRRPFVGFHYTLEGGSSSVWTDVALAVASQIKNSVTATLPDWFSFGSKKSAHIDKPKEVSHEYAERLNCRFGLCDLWRHGKSVIVSPDGIFSAITDSLGRVTLIDNTSGIAQRLWKGFRDAQCGFLQVQEDVKKHGKTRNNDISKLQPRQGLFIVIYAPKKGLIEIFSIHHGRRVASFKVTKYGHLLYFPKPHSGSNILAAGFNLTQNQIIFISEEGFNEFLIPFHCALSENSSKISRDLHVLKKLKTLLKIESNSRNTRSLEEIEKCAMELKTDNVRLQAIESMITYRNISFEAFKVVLNIFWEAFNNKERAEPASQKIISFTETILSLLLFYDFLSKLEELKPNNTEKTTKTPDTLSEELRLPQNELHILLKVIQQVTEIEKIKQQATKVAFDEFSSATKLVNFLSSFDFENFLNILDKNEKLEECKENIPYTLNVKSNDKEKKMDSLGEIFYKGIFSCFSYFDQWKSFVQKIRLNSKDLALCLISFWCNKKINDCIFSEVLFFIEILKAIFSMNDPDIVKVEYNVESPWWRDLRNFIAGNPFAIRGLFAALCCRSVTIFMEHKREFSLKVNCEKKPTNKAKENSSINEISSFNNDWEAISKDSCQWDILIMQLQDIALLNAVLNLTFKTSNQIPVVPFDFEPQCLNSIQTSGIGRISELVAKWLVQFGFEPSFLVDRIDLEFQIYSDGNEFEKKESDLIFPLDKTDDTKNCNDSLNSALEYLALLKSRFPYSLTSSSLLSNMCWEYFAYWYKNISSVQYLETAVKYLEVIPGSRIKYGIGYLSWTTFLEQKFETLAKMINRIGKVPKNELCVPEIGLRNDQVPVFLKLISDVLKIMLHIDLEDKPDFGINKESVWQNSSISTTSSLVFIAVSQQTVHCDLLLFQLQLSYSLLMMSSLNIKHPRVFSSLFDNMERLSFTQSQTPQLSSHHQNLKLKDSRTEFLKKCLTAAVQTIELVEYIHPVSLVDFSNVTPTTIPKVENYKKWLQLCFELAGMWAVPLEDLRKHQICELYLNGFDRLAEEVIPSVNDTSVLASQLLVLGGKRLKYLIQDSNDLSKKLTKLSANLSEWLHTLDLEDFTYHGTPDDIEILMRYIAKWLPEGHSDQRLTVAAIDMDPLYLALSFYKRKKYDKCISQCTEMLEKNAYDQAAWILKMRAFTGKVYIDDLENEEYSFVDEFLDDSIVAEVVKAGTSLRSVKTENTSRPRTDIGHVVTGIVRTNLRSAHSGTMEQALRSARRMKSSRAVTSQSGRSIRLGTASMLSDNDSSFIQISRINLAKYATEIAGKYLFEFLFYHENDIQHALELSSEAARASDLNDWWWIVQVSKCFFYLSLFRESEQNLKKALNQHVNIEIFLRLIRTYKKLDQPLSALDVCNKALEIFPYDINLVVESARLHEALGNISLSVGFYRNVILKDASNIEAIACTGLHYFYSDQPEIALCFYKRLLQMGLLNVEVLNNIGLCCFYSQNYDLALSCFKRALTLADGENVAHVWYNLSHVAIGVGDLNLARLCLRLCLNADGNHSSALNNLGVLETKRNKLSHAKSFFLAAISKAPFLFEPHFNLARLTYQCGDLHASYRSVQKALEISSSHIHSVQLNNKLQRHFIEIQ